MADEQKNLPLFGDKEPPPAETDPAGSGGARGLRATGDGPLKRLVDNNFLQYAAYVIRDRAIPALEDGLKPVQRRILYSLHENDDGKFIKVANIVGYCMQFHPHGDASIEDALVTLANRRYFIERQGNFGNLLAAYYAKRLGVPIARLICASNTNRVLADLLTTGKYEISERKLVRTVSPSMDILVSSNLERLLYELTGNGIQVRDWMTGLSETGSFVLDEVTFARMRREFIGDWVDDETCLATIGSVYEERGYLVDPHTAVAWEVADRHAGMQPMLVVSPAHWSKFPADVVRGLSGLKPGASLPGDELDWLARVGDLAPGHPVPEAIAEACSRPVRFSGQVKGDPRALEQGIRDWLAAA